MEIYVNGPGVTIAAREIGLERYKYWSGRSEMEEDRGSGSGKDLFDYSWNIKGRKKMKVPDNANFLKDKAWSDINDSGNWVINACDYELADIWVEDGGVIKKYRSHDIPHVKHVFKKFEPDTTSRPSSTIASPSLQFSFPPRRPLHPSSCFFYTAFSSEIGNWQHKQYNSSVPIEKFRLQIMEVSRRNWIIGLETTQEHVYDMYEKMHVNRLYVRNLIFLEDWMKATNLRLDYDMFTGNNKSDCSNFKIHDKYFWG